MWSTKKPNTPQTMAAEPKSLPTDKKSTDTRPVESAADQVTACLGSSLRVKGDISRTKDLLIEGSVEGMIQLDERTLTVGTAAKLTTDINARNVVVYGHVKGNVRATGRIEIKRDGSVIGNLTTAQIMIEDGADFRGSIEIDRSSTKDADKNLSSRAASAGAGRV
jgi:cytoskeletal protein CcmA (bactofilin family)